MESGFRLLLLSGTLGMLLVCSGCASVRGWFDRDAASRPAESTLPADQDLPESPSPRVIEPEVERRKVKVPKIDTENVELGAWFGALSIEDFGTNPVYGVKAAYHVTEDFFLQADVGRSTAGRTSFETLAGNVQLLSGDQRRFQYYSLSLGYNFLPGEVFLGRNVAMNSSFYLLGGIGSTKFAGDDKFTVNFGAGYRVLPTDWLTIHVDVQDRVFDSDLLGKKKLTSNLEARIGVTVFF